MGLELQVKFLLDSTTSEQLLASRVAQPWRRKILFSLSCLFFFSCFSKGGLSYVFLLGFENLLRSTTCNHGCLKGMISLELLCSFGFPFFPLN
jgi:hypothetical protein